jgi:transposase
MKTPKRYDDALKHQAIEMALEGTKTIAQVARDLEIKENTLYGWVDKYKRAQSVDTNIVLNASKPIDLAAENKRLKRELKQAQEDVEILKKAAAYFAAHSQ